MPARRPSAKSLDAASLEAAALDYLAHYASSRAHLRQVLMRRVVRARVDEAEGAAASALIDAVVARCVASGFLDDRAFAAQQAASLRRRGVSAAGIRFRLAEKGVEEDVIRAALAAGGETDLAAACALVRRRRLGPFRAPAARAAARDRDLGVLARAGFGLALARRVLAAADPDALEAMERGEPGA